MLNFFELCKKCVNINKIIIMLYQWWYYNFIIWCEYLFTKKCMYDVIVQYAWGDFPFNNKTFNSYSFAKTAHVGLLKYM